MRKRKVSTIALSLFVHNAKMLLLWRQDLYLLWSMQSQTNWMPLNVMMCFIFIWFTYSVSICSLCIIYTGNSKRIHTIPIHSANICSQKSPKSDMCYKDFTFSTFSIWIITWKAQTHLIMSSLQSSNVFLFISDKKSSSLDFCTSTEFQNFTSEEKCVDTCQPMLLIPSAIAVANSLHQTLCYFLNLKKIAIKYVF